jgi:hypothetical protein
MTCTPGRTQGSYSDHAYQPKYSGIGPTHVEDMKSRVNCPTCNKEMCEKALKRHLFHIHGTALPDTPRTTADPTAVPQCYYMSHPKAHVRAKIKAQCPVPNYPGQAQTWKAIREHFQEARHPADTVCIREEGANPLPKCKKCGLQLDHKTLNTKHPDSAQCRNRQKKRHHQNTALQIQAARAIIITAMGQPLEKVPWFRYLGRYLADTNSRQVGFRAR